MIRNRERPSITDVEGIRVGHAADPGGRSGCTVVLGPFRGAVEVPGMATGSRELDVLSPDHISSRVEAIVLSGGSAFGLAAADGVMAWLAERGQGFKIGAATVPLVPAAVIFDLAEGVPRPNAALGQMACESASSDTVPEGLQGGGAGATVGKVRGLGTGQPAGIGSWSCTLGAWTVGALTVVNAFGDILDEWGGVLAGAKGEDGVFVNTSRLLREVDPNLLPTADLAGANTTLSVVATDAPLSRVALSRMAKIAATAMARRISPVNTPFDGDIVFAVSTAERPEGASASEVLALGTAARDTLEIAIGRAVSRDE